MGFRQLYIKEAKKLSLGNNSLLVFKDNNVEPLSFSLEDIDLIFVEDPNVVITARLITETANFGVSIILCGNNYLPTATTIPINGHYLQSNMLNLQLNLLPSKKNKFWETIIKQKITNQMNVIDKTTCDMTTYSRLKDYCFQVKFGDEKNMEGQAAKEYFKSLFGQNFIRFGESPISAALNYGYSILTGAVIRSVAFAGLNDNLGIWHHSAQNANNLSCDLVEVFRAVVDYYVYNHLDSLTTPLSIEIRKDLVNLLNYYVLVNNKKYQVTYAIGLLVNDYVEYLKNGKIEDVHMPEFFVNEGDGNE